MPPVVFLRSQYPSPSLPSTFQISIPPHLYVLPVLLMEFLALALTRAVLPPLLLSHFGSHVYFIMGCVESIRGLLAFVACPMFGKVSDVIGRRVCLFITVLGTCMPVCLLAILPINDETTMGLSSSSSSSSSSSISDSKNMSDALLSSVSNVTTTAGASSLEGEQWTILAGAFSSSASYFNGPDRIRVFVCALALSGLFGSTFTLTFAYISDTVREKTQRVSAYGLALATFGLSFTIGPMLGGYLSSSSGGGGGGGDDNGEVVDVLVGADGQMRVFRTSLLLTVLDLMYIYFILPESTTLDIVDDENDTTTTLTAAAAAERQQQRGTGGSNKLSLSDQIALMKHEIPRHISPWDTLKVFKRNAMLTTVAKVTFLYYTSLYAVVSTLTLYAAKRFRLGPERLGELMSAFGLCTMLAEVVLVRIVVPKIGEKRAMRLGLVAFGCQCVIFGLAYEFWQLFLCVALSLLGNLVYPSLTSLVSASVPPESVGEVLGAVNGIKALTEGFGPLLFGILMTLSEGGRLPGWPYLVAGVFAYMAYGMSTELPDEGEEGYELDREFAGEQELVDLLDQVDVFDDHEHEEKSIFYDCDSYASHNLPIHRPPKPPCDRLSIASI